jgi:hypothetical protein
MAIVYVARQPDLDRQVALKELSRFHAGSAEYAHRFLRESRLAGSLNHQNIVTVHEYFEHNTIPYIAMEYVPRGSLRPYMKRLTLSQIAGVLEGVLAGLAHGEAAGIVHRDLKPENIMVTADGRVKITDFGIARATQRAGTQYMTATGMTVGTPTYMAPEQAMAGDIGSWSDLYSVGVLTYELVVGQVPFHDTDAPMVILMRHVNERIPSAIEVRPDVDPNLSAWIDSLLVKDPAKRVHHAVDAWESLEDIIVGLLGPLWRRNARLLDDQIAVEKATPLTPAPFESQPSIRTPTPASSQAVPAQDQFVTFEPGRPLAEPEVASATPADAGPAPAGPPAPAAPPAPNERVPDPATPVVETPVAEPAPEPSIPEPLVVSGQPEPEGEPESEFVTYNPSPAGAPSVGTPAPPSEAPAEVEPPPEPLGPRVAEAEPAAELAIQPVSQPEAEAVDEPEPALAPERKMAPPPAGPGPVAAAAPEAGRRRRTGRTPFVLLAAVAAIVGAAIGFLVAPSSSHTTTRPPAPLSQTTSAGPLTISFPSGWQKSRGVPSDAASLKLANPVTLTPGHSAPGGALVLGSSSAVQPDLLPASFITALGANPPGAAATLGPHTFKRYLKLVPQNTTTALSVYAVPTATAGTAIAACMLPSAGADAFNAACEHILSSLKIPGTQLPLTASPGYAAALSAAIAKLGRARVSAGGQLANAKGPSGQAAAAHALSGAYQHAAGAVTKLQPGPVGVSANAAIAEALRKLAAGYGALSAAAAHDNSRAYKAARAQIARAESDLKASFGQLRQDGYTLG